jgi:hypothetical protein
VKTPKKNQSILTDRVNRKTQGCPIVRHASLFFLFEVESGLYSSFSKIDSEENLQKGQLFDDKNAGSGFPLFFPQKAMIQPSPCHSFRTIPHRLMVAGDAT